MKDRIGVLTRNRSRGRQIGVAVAAIALLGGIGVAYAATKTVNDFGLAANGRAWDFNSSNFGIGDGAIVAGRFGDDAFDGGLEIEVDGNGFADGDNQGNFNKKQNSFTVGPDTTGDLRVSRTERAVGPYIRSLVKLKNNDGTPYQGTISWNSDLGSDNSEVTQATSNGDTNFTKADRWLVSSETGANGWHDDPTLAFVLYGKQAKEKVDTVVSGPGSGNVDVDFEDLKVPANGTRYLLFYTEMHPNPASAKKSMGKYNPSGLSPALLKGISKPVRNKVVNWKL